MSNDETKALQINPDAHPGAMVCLCLTPEQQQELRDVAGLPDAEADHVTLCYLASDASEIVSAKNALLRWLADIAQCTAPLDGVIGGVARFNASESSDGRDVLVALYDSPCLPDLYAACAGAALCCGAMGEQDRGFTPHITLGYLDGGAPAPLEQLPRMPLMFACLTLIWGGERIDLPFQGATDDQSQYAGETMEDWDDGLGKALKAAGSPGDYLVVEDKDKPSTWHLRVKRGGKVDHRLLGASWAALHGGYRGNKYEGPGKQEAIAKLRTLYKQEEMPVPAKALGTSSLAAGAALMPEQDEGEDEEDEEVRGDSVKALGGGRIGGYLVRFSTENDPDLTGDFFTKETDFGIQNGAKTYVWFNHRKPFKARDGRKLRVADPIGEGTMTIDETGVFVDAVLYNRKRYEELLDALGWSSGTAAYLIDREPRGKKAMWIKRWPLGVDASLTFEPAEPRNNAMAIKLFGLTEEDQTMGDTQAQDTAQSGVDIAQLAANVKSLESSLTERDAKIKSLEAALALKADTSALEPHIAQVKSVRDDLDQIKSLPAVKTAKSRDPLEAAAELGGSIGGGLNRYADSYNPFSYHNMKALHTVSHPGSPTRQVMYPEGVFGGFVKALFMSHKSSPNIQRDAIKALEEVYGSSMDSDAAKALGTSAGVSGAWLLSEQFVPMLMAIAGQKDVLYGRTMVIPVESGEVVIPALDPSTAYSEGQSAYYGGVTVTWGSDDDAAREGEPKFKQVRLSTNALKVFTRIKNSLMMRSAIAIDAVAGNLLGGAIGRARDYAILRGTGQGQPMGVLSAPALIDVGGSAIDFATLAGMEDQVIPERDENYVWIIHSKKRSAIWSLQQTNNTLVTMLPDLRGRPQQVLLGRTVSYTDKTPFASGDVSNTVNLIDPSMIVCAEFQGIALAVSDQARFEQDETVIRAIMSIDAQPWLTSKVAVTATPDYVSGFITI